MYKLVIVQNGRIQKNIPLRHSRVLIGRKPDSDIQLEEKQVSGHHAVITVKNDEAFIEDLESTNGTSVNGQAINETQLQTGDQISIGNYKLIFVTEHGDAEDPDATVIVSSNKKPKKMPVHQQESEEKSSFTRYLIGIIIVALLAGLTIMIL